MDDTIRRQAAIEELRRMMIALYGYDATSVISCAIYKLQNLPSAQPEIIRCKDYKWKQGSECVMFADVRPFLDDFCSRAERRE